METVTAHEGVTQLGLLADPVRRRLYDVVAEQCGPVTREEAASAAGTSRTLAAYHLDRLAEAGLLDVGYAHKPGRAGPGSGRPAKQYTRSGHELVVSLPPRNYSLLAHILADAAASTETGPVRTSLTHAAERAGRRLGERSEGLDIALTSAGYEPADTDDGGVILRNCPFHSVVQDHPELVCTLNQAVIRGALTGTGGDPDRAELDPCDGRCCVVIRPATRTTDRPH